MDTVYSALDNQLLYHTFLYARGFLLTNNKNPYAGSSPFYNEWHEHKVNEYSFWVHKKQRYTKVINGKQAIVLIGHAYEPVISQEYREEKLLDELLMRYNRDGGNHLDYFNLWTGSFVLFIFDGTKLLVYGDPAGIQTVFYGIHNDSIYISSHTNLLADVCSLEMDEYVQRLVNYRFYPLFGRALPGDISPYRGFRRLIPNHNLECTGKDISVQRFFPTKEYCLSSSSYPDLIQAAATILKNSMALIPQKWSRPAISLTGGCDSKTTLSCTTGNFDRYRYFSYSSQAAEEVDAIAAEKICDLLGLPHTLYRISEKDTDFSVLEVYKDILIRNCGNIGSINPNDVRKRIFFATKDDFDVEVKSWVSEIARAYYHKRFAKNSFPKKLTPRYATLLYKVFVSNRPLIKDTKQIFEVFLDKYYVNEDFEQIPWTDLFFWEFRMSSWNGLVISGEQQLSYDITIPYNNRELLRILLSTPEEYRIQDKPHWDIIKLMNTDLYHCDIIIQNAKHTSNRARMERLYLDTFSKFI